MSQVFAFAPPLSFSRMPPESRLTSPRLVHSVFQNNTPLRGISRHRNNCICWQGTSATSKLRLDSTRHRPSKIMSENTASNQKANSTSAATSTLPPSSGGGSRKWWAQFAAEIPQRRSSNEVYERPSSNTTRGTAAAASGASGATKPRESNSTKKYQASKMEVQQTKQQRQKDNSTTCTQKHTDEPAVDLHVVAPPSIKQIQSLRPPPTNRTRTVRTDSNSSCGHRRTYTSELIVGWRSVSNGDVAPYAAGAWNGKGVLFSHTTTIDYVGFTYKEEEKKKCFYTRKELNRSLAKELKQLLKEMNDPFYKDDDDRPDVTCSNRGIEHMTSPSLLRTLQKNKARVCRAVRKEQDRQDRLGIFCDESIAQASLKHSRRASDLAAFRGEADAMAVKAMERNRRFSSGTLHRRLRSDSLAEAALDLAVLPVTTPVADVREASMALGMQDASALPELTEGEVVEMALPDNMEVVAAPPTVNTEVPAAVAETNTSLVEALDLPMDDIVTEAAVAIVADLPDNPADLAAAVADALAAGEILTEQEEPSSPLPAVIIDGNLADDSQESNGEVIINYKQLGVTIPQEIQQAALVVALGDTPEDLSLATPIYSLFKRF